MTIAPSARRRPAPRAGIVSFARVLAVALACAALSACPAPSEPAPGSTGEASSATAESDSAPAATRAPLTPEARAARADALAHALMRVGEAEMLAWTGAIDTIADREFTDASQRPPDDARHVRLLVGSNIRAELEDCGCPRRPLGGLARRATLWFEGQQEGVPAFHLDAGDTLVQHAQVSPESLAPVALRAHGVAEALVAMELHGLAAGFRELLLPPDRLNTIVQSTGLPLIAANVARTDGDALPAHRLVEDEGFRLGIVGVLAHTERDALGELAWRITPAEDAAERGVRTLRAEGAELVVLLAAGGMARAEELLGELRRRDALPDLVAVSGSARMMRGPSFIEGVPVVETGDRGKHLMWLDLRLAPGARPVFLSPESTGQTEVRRWSNAARALRATRARLSTLAPDDVEGRTAQQFILDSQRAHERTMLGVAQRAYRSPRAVEGVASTVEARMVDVELSVEEHAGVRAIVERTKEAQSRTATAPR